MALTLATNTKNDLYLDGRGNIATTADSDSIPGNKNTGPFATLQICEHAAKTLLGEMIYNANEGIPNFQTIWNGSPNIPQWELALRTTLLNVPGVVDVPTLTTNIVNNVLSYQAVIQTVYGIGAING